MCKDDVLIFLHLKCGKRNEFMNEREKEMEMYKKCLINQKSSPNFHSESKAKERDTVPAAFTTSESMWTPMANRAAPAPTFTVASLPSPILFFLFCFGDDVIKLLTSLSLLVRFEFVFWCDFPQNFFGFEREGSPRTPLSTCFAPASLFISAKFLKKKILHFRPLAPPRA